MNETTSKLYSFCSLIEKKKGYESCTYLHPTDLTPNYTHTQSYQLSSRNIPIVTHIHGLEVRPTLDGNPLAWLGKHGRTGPGFLSILQGEKYFANGLFKNDTTTTLLPFPGMNHTYVKVNRYENVQPPGNLWYHDHAMHITQDNVGHGLLGDYIIFDPAVDAQLPGKDFNIFIVTGQSMTPKKKTTSNLPTDIEMNHIEMEMSHELQENPPSIPFFTQNGVTFMRNQTYRIRILNGNFDSVFTNLRFKTECTMVAGEQIDPKTCRKTLKFSVIGTDSALFNRPVHGVTKMTISSAERM